jgi:uncharacterized membrane protein YidH (DUF202 family)
VAAEPGASSGPEPEPEAGGLYRERTALAWNRSGLAVVVCIAVLLRHLWPLRGTAGDGALALVAAAVIVWAVALLLLTTSGPPRTRLGGRAPSVFWLVTVGTVLLAGVAFVLAFFVSP